MQRPAERFDVIVIGSGFGGAMAAHRLVQTGLRVLMLERGGWLRRGPENWEPHGFIDLRPEFSTEEGYATRGERRGVAPALFCVGGLSVFYGCVSLRMRAADFIESAGSPGNGRVNGAPARRPAGWPFDYAELEPYYTLAEELLGVAGETSAAPESPVCADPTSPPRSRPYPRGQPPLAPVSLRLATAAAALGLRPFRLPLAVHYDGGTGRRRCAQCLTCDGFACAIGAKNDMASAILPDLIDRGLRLKPDTVAVRLVAERGRIVAVECVDRRNGERATYRAEQFVLAAGAIGSPHLLLASGLHTLNPAGEAIGRHLVRHCNGIVFGLFPDPPNPTRAFHKQIGIHDFYFTDELPRGRRSRARLLARTRADSDHPAERVGSIQQVHSPPAGAVLERAPRVLHRVTRGLVSRMTGLLAIAADDPYWENGVVIDASKRDRYGLPRLTIHHRYGDRDRARRALLLAASRRVLRAAGAHLFHVHRIDTFSHAAGTVRMGEDPRAAPLDPAGRFRGLANLRVLDGSMLPSCGAVNPSLTIAANALRSADLLVRRD